MEDKINTLCNHYIQSIDFLQSIIDKMYVDWQTGKINTTEYHTKYQNWNEKLNSEIEKLEACKRNQL